MCFPSALKFEVKELSFSGQWQAVVKFSPKISNHMFYYSEYLAFQISHLVQKASDASLKMYPKASSHAFLSDLLGLERAYVSI